MAVTAEARRASRRDNKGRVGRGESDIDALRGMAAGTVGGYSLKKCLVKHPIGG